MAIILYKPGNSYKSPKGIQCQFQICDPFSYEHLLEDGWFRTPEEVVKAEETEAEAKAEEIKKEEEAKAKANAKADAKAKAIVIAIAKAKAKAVSKEIKE